MTEIDPKIRDVVMAKLMAKLQEVTESIVDEVGSEVAAVCLTSTGLGIAAGLTGSAWTSEAIATEAIASIARVKGQVPVANYASR